MHARPLSSSITAQCRWVLLLESTGGTACLLVTGLRLKLKLLYYYNSMNQVNINTCFKITLA